MRSGDLRHRIIVEKKVRSRSTHGEELVSWTTDVPAWAGIYPLRGNQYFASQQVQAGVTHKVVTRYFTLSASTAITPGNCRLKFGSRYFYPMSVINVDERNLSLEFMCNEEV